jgi:hypothetical protein
MLNYIRKHNEKYKNNVMKTNFQSIIFERQKKLGVHLIF